VFANGIQLLKLNAVVGVIGKVAGTNITLAKVGITCALCQSSVDNSFAPGIGRRLDGWPNRTLNVDSGHPASVRIASRQHGCSSKKSDHRQQMGGHGSFSDPRIGVTVVQTPDT
jgi:hypothetical protein